MFMAASVAIIASCDDDTTPVLELENAASLNAILQNMSSARTTMPSSSPRFLGRKQAMARVLSSITSLPSPTTPHRRALLSVKQPTTQSSTSPMSR